MINPGYSRPPPLWQSDLSEAVDQPLFAAFLKVAKPVLNAAGMRLTAATATWCVAFAVEHAAAEHVAAAASKKAASTASQAQLYSIGLSEALIAPRWTFYDSKNETPPVLSAPWDQELYWVKWPE